MTLSEVRRGARGTIAGLAILAAGYVAWGVMVYAGAASSALSFFFLFVPGIAGFASTWLAPKGRLAPSVLLAVPAACFASLLNLTLQMAGTDVGFFSGVQGALRAGAFTLLSAGLFCMVGGLLAVIVRQVRGTA